jgi:protein O-mannosyl-transferase
MQDSEQEFSFKRLFVPLTTFKAIHIIVIVGFIVYFNALFNNFVWDDIAYIITNGDIHNLNIFHFFGPNSINNISYYRPIPTIYFAVLVNLFGLKAFFYHFIQISLHIIDVCLLFYLFQKFFGKTISLFLAMIFLTHPIQVESVVYISATQSELFFLFGILTLIIGTKEILQKRHFLIISISLLLALLSNELGFFFLIATLFFQFLFKRKRFFKFLPFAAVSLGVYFLMRFIIGGIFFGTINSVPIGRLSLLGRAISMPEIAFYYIKTLFYPARLAIDQLWIISAINFSHFYLPLLLDLIFILSLGLLGLFIYRRNNKSFRTFIFFFIWFAMGSLMLLQIIPLDMTVSDRWFYFPLAGFLGIMGTGVQQINLQKKSVQTIAILLAIACILSLSIRTIIRNQNWHTGLTLYAHDVPLEDNFDNENNYAAVFGFEGDYGKALPHIKRSVDIFPYEKNLFNLGITYRHLGQSKLEIEYYYKALNSTSFIKDHKHDVLVYYQTAKFQLAHDNIQEAKRILKEGLRDYPASGDLWMYLAVSEYKLQNQKDALYAADKSKTLLPNDTTNAVYSHILNKQPISVE